MPSDIPLETFEAPYTPEIEQEHTRLMALRWHPISYARMDLEGADKNDFHLWASVAPDGEYVVVRHYSAQPPPNWQKLPSGIVVERQMMLLEPYFYVFSWLCRGKELIEAWSR